MAKHEHGTMNTEVQEKTFAGFMRAATYVACGVVVLLIFLALVNG